MGEDENASQGMDAVLIALGWRGRFQLLQLFQLMLCFAPAAFHMLSIVFIGKTNQHKCQEIDNSTSHLIPPDVTNVTYDTCSVTWENVTGGTMEIPCPAGLEFNEPPDRSLMSEWGLVCGNEALTDMSQSLLLAGMMVGAVPITSLADRYGRKPVHIGCSLGLLVTGVAVAFVPSFTAFLPLRFCLGAFQLGMDLTSAILCLEILPTRQRVTQCIVSSLLWATGMVVLTLLAFLMRHFSWRYLQLLITAFSAYSVLMIWFLEESLRWLVANGKTDRAERVLKKAAAQNKVPVEDVLNVFRTKALGQQTSGGRGHLKNETSEAPEEHPFQNNENGSAASDRIKDLPKYGLLDFCRNRHVFVCIVINGFAWCVNAVTYNGLSLMSVTLADDMYLGFFLSAVVEIPGVCVLILMEKFGRKRCCDVFHVLAGLSLLASVALSSLAGDSQVSRIAVITLSLLGKFAITCSFVVLFLYTPELFPTNLRNLSLGVASMAGRVGGMIAPYSRTLSMHLPWAPSTIFGTLCLLLPLCMRKLPETCGRELPQTIEQMELYITAPYRVSRPPDNDGQAGVV